MMSCTWQLLSLQGNIPDQPGFQKKKSLINLPNWLYTDSLTRHSKEKLRRSRKFNSANW
jgi:hypothetical protein